MASHDFHEIETLAENDRIRYTISPAARKEVLRRLLALNHARAKDESAAGATNPPKLKRKKKNASDDNAIPDLFGKDD